MQGPLQLGLLKLAQAVDAKAICAFAILGWSFQPGKTPIEYTSLAFLALIIITGSELS